MGHGLLKGMTIPTTPPEVYGGTTNPSIKVPNGKGSLLIGVRGCVARFQMAEGKSSHIFLMNMAVYAV